MFLEFFCVVSSLLESIFFFFSNCTKLTNRTQFSNPTLSIFFKSHSFFFLALNLCFRYFSIFCFCSPLSEFFFFFFQITQLQLLFSLNFFFRSLVFRSYQLCFLSQIFFFRSRLSDNFFFSQIKIGRAHV